MAGKRGGHGCAWLAGIVVSVALGGNCFAQPDASYPETAHPEIGRPDPEPVEAAAAEDAPADEASQADSAESNAADSYPLAALFGPLAHGPPGLELYFVYTADTFTNAHGGLNTSRATEFRGNLDLTLTFDLDKLSWPLGGEVFLYFQEGHGRGISEPHVGDYQGVSNIDIPDLTQLSEYWWRKRLFDERFWFKLGKQDATNDFSSTDAASGFCNNGFWNPYNIPLPVYPDPGPGLAVGWDLADDWSLEAGVYDGAPDGRLSGLSNLGDHGAFAIFEATFHPLWGDEETPLGTYRLGAWHHGGDFDEVGLPEPHRVAGNYGWYAACEQTLLGEAGDAAAGQGLAAFFHYGWAPDDRNETPHALAAGLVYTGLLPGRDEDSLGFGLAQVRFAERLRASEGRAQETAWEWYYRVQAAPWLVVQPDMQYIHQPNGDGRDAVVVGLRLEAEL